MIIMTQQLYSILPYMVNQPATYRMTQKFYGNKIQQLASKLFRLL